MARILLVDDDVDLVRMHEIVLSKRGHDIKAAYTASEAKASLDEQMPELVVLDVMLETLDSGFELARQIHKTHPEVITIVLTSVHEATGVPFRFEPDDTWLPVIEVMDKPVDPVRLADKIEALLKKNKNG